MVIFMMFCLCMVGCSSDFNDSEQVAIDFYEKIFIDYDFDAAEKMMIDERDKENVKKTILSVEKKQLKTDRAIMVPHPYASLLKDQKVYIIGRTEYNDSAIIKCKKVDDGWRIVGFDYEETTNFNEIEKLDTKEIRF